MNIGIAFQTKRAIRSLLSWNYTILSCPRRTAGKGRSNRRKIYPRKAKLYTLKTKRGKVKKRHQRQKRSRRRNRKRVSKAAGAMEEIRKMGKMKNPHGRVLGKNLKLLLFR
ncbi:MAG: hypothetical protein LBG22_06565 [Treponema sp.]|nr:hypothetical protein [Treponema sp.]